MSKYLPVVHLDLDDEGTPDHMARLVISNPRGEHKTTVLDVPQFLAVLELCRDGLSKIVGDEAFPAPGNVDSEEAA